MRLYEPESMGVRTNKFPAGLGTKNGTIRDSPVVGSEKLLGW